MAPRLHGWRKLAGSTWRAPSDPQFYGDLELDAAGLLDFAETARRHTGAHVTMTHLAGRAVAHGLATVPEMRVRPACGRERVRESIDVFFVVATGGGQELTGVKLQRVDDLSAVEVAQALERRRASIDGGDDPELGRGKAMMGVLPPVLLRRALGLAAWLTSDLNLDLTRFGMPRQTFGGAMITSVGMWGIGRAYSPLAPYYRVPVLVLVGAVQSRPVAISGEVVVRPMLTLTATFDHRYVDGYHAARFAQAIQEYCAHPAAFEPPFQAGVRAGAPDGAPADARAAEPPGGRPGGQPG